RVSGLDINGIRVSYSQADDVLSIGLQQPENQKTGQLVIAGDVDNSLDGASVDPAVAALRPGEFTLPDGRSGDFGFLGGSETMGSFLDLDNDNVPDIVAGISNEEGQPKLYQVSRAVVNPALPPTIGPGFGEPLPFNTGRAFLANDPNRPSFEFDIENFSQLYLAETGRALNPADPTQAFRVGAFGNSANDDGISEAFFPAQPVNLTAVTVPVPPPPMCPPPPPPPPCPPVSPPIKVNPHEGTHIDTVHQGTRIRAYVFGTSGFDVTQIIPQSVRLGGAAPVNTLIKRTNTDAFPDATFTFNGRDVTLPPGRTSATLTGTLRDGTTFSSTVQVFNRDESFYSPAQVAQQEARIAVRQARRAASRDVIAQVQTQANAPAARSSPAGSTSTSAVAIPRRASAWSDRGRARPSPAAEAQAPRVVIPARHRTVATTTAPEGHGH
ncbi:MAG TPA: hypothetical protein VF590_10795, partial [Isosphaeraceae bacterium]